jgi:hypothetical protein
LAAPTRPSKTEMTTEWPSFQSAQLAPFSVGVDTAAI